MIRNTIFFILISFIICNPVFSHLSDEEQAILDAIRDAKAKSLENFSIGTVIACISCISGSVIASNVNEPSLSEPNTILLPGICIIGAVYLMSPQVPATKLLGKSPEYVTHYTRTYKSKVRWDRAAGATTGCLTTGALGYAIYFYALSIGGGGPG